MSTTTTSPTQGSSSRHRNGSETGTGTTTSKALVPTNNVTTIDGTIVRARIDPALTVDDVVKQLCVNLKIKGHSTDYALRDEADELVTSDNLRKKIKGKVNLRLVNSPRFEAVSVIEKLSTGDAKSSRMTLFSLQKQVKEPEFAHHFLNYEGLVLLVQAIHESHGNTLAYALTAMQLLMDLDYGWSTLDDHFILRIVRVLTSPQSLVNVTRPATVILKKFVEAEPANPSSQSTGSSRDPSFTHPNSVFRYGFKEVYQQVQKEPDFLQTVIQRLSSAETATTQYSMTLINSLLTHVSDDYWEEFIADLERLDVRKAVVKLMSSHTSEDLTSCILDFQANMVRVTYQKKRSFVDYQFSPAHRADLDYIWSRSGLQEQHDGEGAAWKWRLLGFTTEDLEQEFDGVGVLGLDCLKEFVRRQPDFAKLLEEQLGRPLERRCPIAKASNEIVELLAEHWAIFAPGYSTSTTFQPFFLDLYKAHSLALQFFLRMWLESSAAKADFMRVTALVRSQVKVALRSENVRPWYEVEKDFNESEYRAVRERQMKELELEDDLLSKAPVRNLRAKIYKESYEFVRQQRTQCLLHGAWFVNAVPQGSNTRPSRPWRFMRLDTGLKYLHYVDSAMKFPVREGLEDLPERIELAAISEIATGTCAAPPGVLRDYSEHVPHSTIASTASTSPLSFSLLSALDGSLADQIAPDQSRWADWTDGLNMLRRDGGHVASKETAGFVQALTEIGLKIKLLDLSGEMVEIPSGLSAGPPPMNTDFYFSDL